MTVTTTLSHVPLGGQRLSRRTLRRSMGRGPLYQFLDTFALHDTIAFQDDFQGDTINLDNYALGNGAGASAVAFAKLVGRGGWIRGTCGTANGVTASQSLIGPAEWYGDANCELTFRWKATAVVTELRIEMGFVDVVPGTTASVVNSLTTPTVNASVVDAAVYVYNHTGATTTNELVTIGTTIAAAKTTFTPPTAVAATTEYTTRLKLQGNTAMLWMDGQLVATHAADATDYVEGGSPLAIWLYVRANDATSKTLDVDYIQALQDRGN